VITEGLIVLSFKMAGPMIQEFRPRLLTAEACAESHVGFVVGKFH
jgi:hypothetical protein